LSLLNGRGQHRPLWTVMCETVGDCGLPAARSVRRRRDGDPYSDVLRKSGADQLSARKPRLWVSRPKVAPPRECRSSAEGYLAATRAVEQKESRSWKRGTEVVDRIREVGGRAPALSQRISMAGVVHRPMPDGDEAHPRRRDDAHRACRYELSSDAIAKASPCIAPSTKPVSDGQFPRATGSAPASGWGRCCLSWWRDLTPSLRNALRRW
jgi:hypothetical protein